MGDDYPHLYRLKKINLGVISDPNTKNTCHQTISGPPPLASYTNAGGDSTVEALTNGQSQTSSTWKIPSYDDL